MIYMVFNNDDIWAVFSSLQRAKNFIQKRKQGYNPELKFTVKRGALNTTTSKWLTVFKTK